MAGVLRQLDLGPHKTTFIGYNNQGGTLNLEGMLNVNGQSAEGIQNTAKDMINGAK